MDIVLDFSFADQVGSWFYDISQSSATDYLRLVAQFFSDIFLLAEIFYTRIGFIWIILAAVFFTIVTRVVLSPILGGRAMSIGPDRASRGNVRGSKVNNKVDNKSEKEPASSLGSSSTKNDG